MAKNELSVGQTGEGVASQGAEASRSGASSLVLVCLLVVVCCLPYLNMCLLCVLFVSLFVVVVCCCLYLFACVLFCAFCLLP